VSPVLAQRAVSEDPRWTRAVGNSSGPSWANVNEQAWKLATHCGLADNLFEHPANEVIQRVGTILRFSCPIECSALQCAYGIHCDHDPVVPQVSG